MGWSKTLRPPHNLSPATVHQLMGGKRHRGNQIDDLDGTLGADIRTYSFSIEGNRYEISLKPRNFKRLLKALKPFTDQARPAARASHTRRPYVYTGETTDTPRDARQWALDNGFKVKPMGRLPKDLIAAYNQAFPSNEGAELPEPGASDALEC